MVKPRDIAGNAQEEEEPRFLRSSHTSDVRIGTVVAAVPGSWRFWVTVRTGWPGVNVLSLGRSIKLDNWVRTDGPPHPPGLSHLAATEIPVMAAG